MRTYEMTVILRLAEEDFTKGRQLILELLEKNGITVVKKNDLGIRVLAYQIKKEEKGHYLYFEIQGEPDVIIQLERALKLMQPVLKFLIVRKELMSEEPKEVKAAEPVEVKETEPETDPVQPEEVEAEAPEEESEKAEE